MLRAALTGGIACGKSTVLQLFRETDPAFIFTLSSDEIVHQLYAPGSKLASAVASAFGVQVLTPEGGIDRARLADIAFHDEASRKRLENIVHPAVIQWQADWMVQLEQQHPEVQLALVEIPLLFEAGSEKRFQKSIAVTCPPEQKLARYRARHPELSEAQAQAEIERRTAAQFPDQEKARRADLVIDNSGTLEQLRAKVHQTVRSLLQ